MYRHFNNSISSPCVQILNNLTEIMYLFRQQLLMKTAAEMAEVSTAPVFKTELRDATAREGGYAHLEARLEPVGDPTLKVEWLKDGRPMEASQYCGFVLSVKLHCIFILKLIIQILDTDMYPTA